MRRAAPIGSRARRLLPATWMPLAAMAVHQLRFSLAYGPSGGRELTATGHSYLHSLTPWIALLCALGAGVFMRRLARAWHDGETCAAPRRSLLALWLIAAVALVFIYMGQEALEGLLASGHPAGLAGIFGGGGWLALPAAVAVGGALALLVHGGRAAIRLAARRARQRPLVRARRLRAPAPVFLIPASPLARCAPGRAPPPVPA